MTNFQVRISFLVLFFLCTSPVHAESTGQHFNQETLTRLKACLGGTLSKSDEKRPVRQNIEKGNLAFLDQRKPSFTCPNPDTSTLAWMELSEGDSAADLHIMRMNTKKEFVSERYRVDLTTLKDSAHVTIPGSEHSCAPDYQAYLAENNDTAQKPKLTLKISTWELERQPCDPRPFDLKRRFSFEHVSSLPSGTAALTSDQFRKVDSPPEAQILEEVFRHLARTFERADDFILDMTKSERKNLLESCLAAQQSLEKLLPPGRPSTAAAAARSRHALTEASSIFVSAIEGHTTIGKFQEQSDARAMLLKQPEKSCSRGGAQNFSPSAPSPPAGIK